MGDSLPDDESLEWLHRELEALERAWGAEMVAGSGNDFRLVMLSAYAYLENKLLLFFHDSI